MGIVRASDDSCNNAAGVARDARAGPALAHRGRQGEPKRHDGTIVTSAPDVMWGTDGVRVLTADDGWVWAFAAVDHWNAECVGWHVCKVGSRFAALEPVAQGLRRHHGSVEADAARGLALRMDHSSQYLSDHFLNQVRYGIRPSFRLARRAGDQRRRRALEPHAQGAKRSTAGSFEASPTCAPPLPSSSNATTRTGASRSSRIVRRSRPAREYELRQAA